MSNRLTEAIVGMREKEAITIAKEMLQNDSPEAVLAQAQEAMTVLGARFEREEAFLPELMMGGEMMKAISAEVKPYLRGKAIVAEEGKGTVVIGTVAGDIHDIGKDIVVFMLDVEGYQVIDLGINVPIHKFVDAIKEYKPQVVGLSGLLTAVFATMKETIQAIEAAGLRDQVKIMIGGTPVDAQVCNFAGADGWGIDVTKALRMAREWTGEEA
jgi:trimethylamine corrinoid protein